jgi:hypothetical protein
VRQLDAMYPQAEATGQPRVMRYDHVHRSLNLAACRTPSRFGVSTIAAIAAWQL